MAKTFIVELILNDARGWGVGKTIDVLLSIVSAIEDIEDKVSRNLRSSFERAKTVLELAQKYSEYRKRKFELERAKNLFEKAAFKLTGVEKIHALCLAGLCANLADDLIARDHYYHLALKEINSFIPREKKRRWRASSLKGVFAGAGLGTGISASLFILLWSWGPITSLYAAAIFIFSLYGGGVSGLISGAIGTVSGAFIDVNNIKFNVLECTLGELQEALENSQAHNLFA